MLSLAFDILQQVFAPFQSLAFFLLPKKNRIVLCINLHIFSIIQSAYQPKNISIEIYQIRKDFAEIVCMANFIIENRK